MVIDKLYRAVWPKPKHYYVGNHPRTQAREPVIFQELRPLKLRNRVCSKESKTSDNSCLQEMAVLFACLKANEFKEPMCQPEIQSFQNCYTVFNKKKADMRRVKAEGILEPGARVLTANQLNNLLKRYPQTNG